MGTAPCDDAAVQSNADAPTGLDATPATTSGAQAAATPEGAQEPVGTDGAVAVDEANFTEHAPADEMLTDVRTSPEAANGVEREGEGEGRAVTEAAAQAEVDAGIEAPVEVALERATNAKPEKIEADATAHSSTESEAKSSHEVLLEACVKAV